MPGGDVSGSRRELSEQHAALLARLCRYKKPRSTRELFEALRRSDSRHWYKAQQVATGLAQLERLGLATRLEKGWAATDKGRAEDLGSRDVDPDVGRRAPRAGP